MPFKLQEEFEEIPVYRAALVMMNFVVLVAFGYLRDFMRARNWEPSLFKVERAAQAVRVDLLTLITHLIPLCLPQISFGYLGFSTSLFRIRTFLQSQPVHART